jgi:hypothetical protein
MCATNSNMKRLAVALLSAAAVAGCGTLHAPRGSVPEAQQAGSTAFGGWARVAYDEGGERRTREGELIAVGPDTLWLMQSAPLAIPVAQIVRAEVTGFDSRPGNVIAAAGLGVLTTLSNGAFLVFTAPAWLITGAVASSSQARLSRIEARVPNLAPLAHYARFPQGLPPDVDLTTLRPRQP